MPKTKTFCVLNLENSTAWQPINFGDMFMSRLWKQCADGCCPGTCRCSSVGEYWCVCNVAAGEAMPSDIDEYQAVVLTGSRFNCRDGGTLEFFDAVCDFVRRAAQKGAPRIFGGCFGCQLIAHALGGEVDYNPQKNFVLKAETIKLDVGRFSHHLQSLGQDSLCMLASHGDCVRQLPPHSEQLATSLSCENEIFITGRLKNILACQSHPEFEFTYCIQDRIWPSVVDSKQRLTQEEIAEAMASFEGFTPADSVLFMAAVGRFLRE